MVYPFSRGMVGPEVAMGKYDIPILERYYRVILKVQEVNFVTGKVSEMFLADETLNLRFFMQAFIIPHLHELASLRTQSTILYLPRTGMVESFRL